MMPVRIRPGVLKALKNDPKAFFKTTFFIEKTNKHVILNKAYDTGKITIKLPMSSVIDVVMDKIIKK